MLNLGTKAEILDGYDSKFHSKSNTFGAATASATEQLATGYNKT